MQGIWILIDVYEEAASSAQQEAGRAQSARDLYDWVKDELE